VRVRRHYRTGDDHPPNPATAADRPAVIGDGVDRRVVIGGGAVREHRTTSANTARSTDAAPG
jgi:hypothetical protein